MHIWAQKLSKLREKTPEDIAKEERDERLRQAYLAHQRKKYNERLTYSMTDEALKRSEELRRLAEERELKARLELQKKIEQEMKDRERMISIWESYGFEGFLHTTELENFEKILRCGYLYSRFDLKKQQMFFNDKANGEVIDHTNEDIIKNCRFYYYFKTPTNYKAKYLHSVILVFDKNIIFNGARRLYFNGNAASSFSTGTDNATKAIEFDWEAIFERGYYGESKLMKLDKGDFDCTMAWNNITRVRNAEFQMQSPVSISDIVTVYFKNVEDMNRAFLFADPAIRKKFKFDRSKFS